MELFGFSYDPSDLDNLISSSSAFSNSSEHLEIHSSHTIEAWLGEFWALLFIWGECNIAVVWTFFIIAFLWDWNENWHFPVLWPCWVFHICWHIECSTFIALSFRIWNSSTEIPSPPLALFIVMLSKAHLTSHSRSLDLGEWSYHRGYLGHSDLFCVVLLCILATSS